MYWEVWWTRPAKCEHFSKIQTGRIPGHQGRERSLENRRDGNRSQECSHKHPWVPAVCPGAPTETIVTHWFLETSRPQSTPGGYTTFLFISHCRMHLGIRSHLGGSGMMNRPRVVARPGPWAGGSGSPAPPGGCPAPSHLLGSSGDWDPWGSPASHGVPFQRHCLAGGGWPLGERGASSPCRLRP